MMPMSHDAQELADVLDAVGNRVPALLRSLLDLLYSPESAQRMGQAVGTLYKELLAAGIPEHRALRIVQDYASPLQLLRAATPGAFAGREGGSRGRERADEDDGQ